VIPMTTYHPPPFFPPRLGFLRPFLHRGKLLTGYSFLLLIFPPINHGSALFKEVLLSSLILKLQDFSLSDLGRTH